MINYKPIVTVALACFNNQDYIDKALLSIQNQSFKKKTTNNQINQFFPAKSIKIKKINDLFCSLQKYGENGIFQFGPQLIHGKPSAI